MAAKMAAEIKSERFSANADEAWTLPARYYYDPEIFDREKRAIWYRTWQYIGPLQWLQKSGDYIADMIIDQPVFVIRNDQGELRAYHNVCMHRGHTLLEGRGTTNLITCPFHAWTYDHDGNLKVAANSQNVAGFDKQDFCLPKVQVGVLANMVFVNLDPEAPGLHEYLSGLEEDIRSKVPRFDELSFARQDDLPCDFNWKLVMDQNECYHCPYVHHGVVAGKGAYLEPSFDITMHDRWDAVVVRSKEDAKSPYGAGKGDEVEDVYIWTVFPNLVLSTHQGPSNFKVQRTYATGADTAHSVLHSLCLNNPPTERDISQLDYFVNRIWAEDSPCMTKQQIGMRSMGYSQGRLMVDKERSWRSEHAVHHFGKLVWEAVNGAKPTS